MLAVTAALYEMMGMDYFRDQFFEGTFMDETESIDVMKNYLKEHLTKTEIAKTSKNIEENVRLFNKIKEAAKDEIKQEQNELDLVENNKLFIMLEKKLLKRVKKRLLKRAKPKCEVLLEKS